jgi:hypothetical protein
MLLKAFYLAFSCALVCVLYVGGVIVLAKRKTLLNGFKWLLLWSFDVRSLV